MPQVFEQSLFLFVTKTLHIKNIPSGAHRQTPLGAVLILKKRGGELKDGLNQFYVYLGHQKWIFLRKKVGLRFWGEFERIFFDG